MAGQNDTPLLDEAKLEQWVAVFGLQKLKDLIRTYKTSAAVSFATLTAALASRDSEACGFHAHKIAGAAVNLGFPALYRLGKAAEAAAKKGDAEEAFALAQAMADLQARSLEALEVWLGGRG
ncbi:MAG: hypothetical protein EPN26_08410 [Rhodospirillales bacterium]|nr:MAG: hypothetical protein EPN26_08410 [Rhodospirillales bacterium]